MKSITALILTVLATPVAALTPLNEEPVVVSNLYQFELANEVRKKCDTIEPRRIRALGYLKSIERYALKAGYSNQQIDQLVEDKAEKKKLRTWVRADLAKRGATSKTPEGYCTVGREEIAKDSAAGRLLRAK